MLAYNKMQKVFSLVFNVERNIDNATVHRQQLSFISQVSTMCEKGLNNVLHAAIHRKPRKIVGGHIKNAGCWIQSIKRD